MINNWIRLGAASSKKPVEYINGLVTASKSSTLNISSLGAQAGDIMIFCASSDDSNFSLSSTGWTDISGGTPIRRVLGGLDFMVGWKVVGAVPDASITTNLSVDVIQVILLRGVSTIDPFYELTSFGASASIFNLSATTVSNKGSMGIIITCLDDDNSVISSVPSGYTLATQGSGGAGGGATSSAAIMYQEEVPVGIHDAPAGQWSSPDGLIAMGIIVSPS